MAIPTSDNLLLSRVTKSNLQSTANGYPAHAVTGGPHSGVELRAIFPAKVQLTANCPRKNSSPVCSQLHMGGGHIADQGGEDCGFTPSCETSDSNQTLD